MAKDYVCNTCLSDTLEFLVWADENNVVSTRLFDFLTDDGDIGDIPVWCHSCNDHSFARKRLKLVVH